MSSEPFTVSPKRNQTVTETSCLAPSMTLAAEGTIFNVINANTVLTESETLGTKVTPYLPGGIGGQPVQVANPRMLRLSLQFKF